MRRAFYSLAKALLLFVLLTVVGVHAWRASAHANLGFNTTESVPLGFYALYGPLPMPPRGAYVCLLGAGKQAPVALQHAIATGLAPSAWRSTPLLKQVVGVAGDAVSYEQGHVFINGHPLPHSAIREADSLGQRLPRPSYPLTLAAGEVWLASQHEHGFDSRYFGPVRTAALTCEGRPLWTF